MTTIEAFVDVATARLLNDIKKNGLGDDVLLALHALYPHTLKKALDVVLMSGAKKKKLNFF